MASGRATQREREAAEGGNPQTITTPFRSVSRAIFCLFRHSRWRRCKFQYATQIERYRVESGCERRKKCARNSQEKQLRFLFWLLESLLKLKCYSDMFLSIHIFINKLGT
jgi:hypothetical protein